MPDSHRSSRLGLVLLLPLALGFNGPAATPTEQLGPAIAQALQPFVDNHTLAGAVTLVAVKDRVVDLQAVGYSDGAAHKRMRPDALFWIASMSKPMTATALMMLVDEGKVDLDDPVEKYLPEFAGQMLVESQESGRVVLKHPARPITVRHILSHTSGLPFMSRIEHKIDTWPLATAAVSYALTPLQTEPGTHYDYSNAGINTAGRIIEVVSGMPYDEFMSRRLFQPLGMNDTTSWPTPKQLRRLAKSYKPNAAKNGLEETTISQLTYPLDNRRRGPSPAGGFFSTATDLSLFCRMILNGGVGGGKRYVSEAAIQQMTCAQTGDLSGHNGDGYGLGWAVSGRPLSVNGPANVGSFGHGGAYATNMQIDPRRGLITIFMVQHAGYPGPDGPKVLPAFTHAAAEHAPAVP